MPERDERIGEIAQQDLKTCEGVEERTPVERAGVEHKRRPCLPGQAIYLFKIYSLL
jgi:hypothetical protein